MDYIDNTTSQRIKEKALFLSEVELEILHYIKKGKTSAEIASIRNCSARTVEKHRSNIILKLGIPSSANALLIWVMENL